MERVGCHHIQIGSVQGWGTLCKICSSCSSWSLNPSEEEYLSNCVMLALPVLLKLSSAFIGPCSYLFPLFQLQQPQGHFFALRLQELCHKDASYPCSSSRGQSTPSVPPQLFLYPLLLAPSVLVPSSLFFHHSFNLAAISSPVQSCLAISSLLFLSIKSHVQPYKFY